MPKPLIFWAHTDTPKISENIGVHPALKIYGSLINQAIKHIATPNANSPTMKEKRWQKSNSLNYHFSISLSGYVISLF